MSVSKGQMSHDAHNKEESLATSAAFLGIARKNTCKIPVSQRTQAYSLLGKGKGQN